MCQRLGEAFVIAAIGPEAQVDYRRFAKAARLPMARLAELAEDLDDEVIGIAGSQRNPCRGLGRRPGERGAHPHRFGARWRCACWPIAWSTACRRGAGPRTGDAAARGCASRPVTTSRHSPPWSGSRAVWESSSTSTSPRPRRGCERPPDARRDGSAASVARALEMTRE